MDQQVSPAVVVIVLILIVAILVGLYFLVVERKPASEQPADEVPPGVEMAPEPGVGPGAPAEEAGAEEQAPQSEEGVAPTQENQGEDEGAAEAPADNEGSAPEGAEATGGQ